MMNRSKGKRELKSLDREGEKGESHTEVQEKLMVDESNIEAQETLMVETVQEIPSELVIARSELGRGAATELTTTRRAAKTESATKRMGSDRGAAGRWERSHHRPSKIASKASKKKMKKVTGTKNGQTLKPRTAPMTPEKTRHWRLNKPPMVSEKKKLKPRRIRKRKKLRHRKLKGRSRHRHCRASEKKRKNAYRKLEETVPFQQSITKLEPSQKEKTMHMSFRKKKQMARILGRAPRMRKGHVSELIDKARNRWRRSQRRHPGTTTRVSKERKGMHRKLVKKKKRRSTGRLRKRKTRNVKIGFTMQLRGDVHDGFKPNSFKPNTKHTKQVDKTYYHRLGFKYLSGSTKESNNRDLYRDFSHTENGPRVCEKPKWNQIGGGMVETGSNQNPRSSDFPNTHPAAAAHPHITIPILSDIVTLVISNISGNEGQTFTDSRCIRHLGLAELWEGSRGIEGVCGSTPLWLGATIKCLTSGSFGKWVSFGCIELELQAIISVFSYSLGFIAFDDGGGGSLSTVAASQVTLVAATAMALDVWVDRASFWVGSASFGVPFTSLGFLGDGYTSGDDNSTWSPCSLIALAHKEKEINNSLEGAGTQPTGTEVAYDVYLRREEKTERVGNWKVKVYGMLHVMVSVKSRQVPGAMKDEEHFAVDDGESMINAENNDEYDDVVTAGERKQLDSSLRMGNADGNCQDEENGVFDCQENGFAASYENCEANGAVKDKKSWFGWKGACCENNNQRCYPYLSLEDKPVLEKRSNDRENRYRRSFSLSNQRHQEELTNQQCSYSSLEDKTNFKEVAGIVRTQ